MMGIEREDDETQATSRRSVIVVGRGLATVMGGGVAILVGVTVIWVFNFFLSEFVDFSVSGGHDAGRAYGRASAATGLTGSLLGLFAMDLLLAFSSSGDICARSMSCPAEGCSARQAAP